MEMQHICGRILDVKMWKSHGEEILDVSDTTGAQLSQCPECGGEFFSEMLFPLDIFPEVFVEMAEQVVEV